jgi:hypothetical protein
MDAEKQRARLIARPRPHGEEPPLNQPRRSSD